jgi:plastocyanin
MYARMVVLLAMVLLLAQGCTSSPQPERPSSPTEPETIAVRATEYAYSMPKRVTGGVVTFEMVNAGREPHVFTLVPLGRHTEKELLAALKRGGPPPWASDAIGVAPIGPGRTVKTTLKIDQPGTYALVCSLPSPKGPPHVLLGMIGSFEVSGASEATFPKPDATIVATEKGLEVPALAAGDHTVEFRNAGKKEHEFFLYALKPGKTSKDVDAWFESGQQGPAPVTFVGGFEAVPPGTSRFQQVHLEAGLKYTLEDVVGGHTVRFTVS